MATLNPYLNFDGNTEEAFNFYKSVFGGEFLSVNRFRNVPGLEHIPEEEKDKIMHIALPIGKGNVLMATDTLKSFGHKLEKGNNISLSLFPESEQETETLFKALSEGGTVDQPLEKAVWGAYFGMVTDKFGIRWMLNYDYNQKNA